ncbi:unnamed protein product [Bursaphelenchus okinawaensis]|uniref:Aquaporin n=1 Tax=Bursaphelenchus okinawaensis TaxID=465554 RepID=A0A811L6W3_9BILA|nr:unnamed protein product [Bursaphelenchus okinawaensis]CAG9116936.1 unnamed protein product [Bursaphelenchus okinawaensis]
MVTDVAWTPAITALTFYAFVIVVAEICRKLVERVVRKGSVTYVFFMELIAVTQQCTCVYENAIMIKNYGPAGFFFAVFTIASVTSQYNRGAYLSPFLPIEALYKEAMKTETFLAILTAQSLGGYAASRVADGLWYYTMSYSAEHAALYTNLPCAISFKVPYIAALGYEVAGCFALRLLLSRVSVAYRRYIMPLATAGALTFALVYIGVPALNPVTTSSRVLGCPGLDLQWFMITYWTAPVVGWMLASYVDKNALFKKPKAAKTKKNK